MRSKAGASIASSFKAGDTVTAGAAVGRAQQHGNSSSTWLDREGRLVESITQLQTYETQLEQKPCREPEGARADRLQRHSTATFGRQAKYSPQPMMRSRSRSKNQVQDELDF